MVSGFEALLFGHGGGVEEGAAGDGKEDVVAESLGECGVGFSGAEEAGAQDGGSGHADGVLAEGGGAGEV